MVIVLARSMIVPYPSTASSAGSGGSKRSTRSKMIHRTVEFTRQVSRYWSKLHVGYRGGTYSIERMLALHEYMENSSRVRVMKACLSAPTSVAVFIIALEAVPLQDPLAGWSTNYGFWIRVAICAMVVANGFLAQIKHFVEGCIISPRQLFMMILFAAVLETPLVVLVAACTTFPIPFSILTMAPTFYPILLSLFCAIVPREVIREMLKHYDHIVRYLKFTAALQVMAVIYPVYQTLFHYVRKTKCELPVMLLLPIIKLVLKNIILHTVNHMEDMMPEAVIFTVDFFNALYISSSMETATSTTTVVIVVLIDIIQSMLVLYRLNQRTAHLRDVSDGSNDLLGAAFHLSQSINEFSRQNRKRIRIRSTLPCNLSLEGRDLLACLETASRRTASDAIRRHSSPLSSEPALFVKRHTMNKATTWADRKARTIATPAGTIVIAVPSSTKTCEGKITAVVQQDTLLKTLEVLFTTECLLLSASLDALVPLFYGSFLLLMVRLPNGKYHSDLSGVTRENIGGVVETVFVYSLVEFVAFVALAMLIYRNLAMNAFYHVAFVLETHSELIRAKMLTWILMTMAFRVVHFGIDFTFKFAWLPK